MSALAPGRAAGPRAVTVRPAAALVAVLVLLATAVSLAPVAAAEPPTRLADQVTDTTGKLDVARATSEVQKLQQNTGYQLFVVFTGSFDGLSGPDWSAQTTRLSQLGDRDVLLAVAVDDRAYGFGSPQGSSTALSSRQTGSIEPAIEQQLGAGDWDAAVTAATDGISSVASGGAGSGGGSSGTAPSGSSGSSGSGLGWLLVVGLVVVGGAIALFATLAARRRAREGGTKRGRAQAPPEPIEDLARRAGAALVATDDAVDSSATEVGFAAAEFGEEATAPYAAALEKARSELSAAFAAHRTTTDPSSGAGSPDDGSHDGDEQARRRGYAEVLARTSAADALLDEQAESFEALRDLAKNVPALLPRLGADLDALSQRAPQATQRLDELSARWAPSALASVAGTQSHVAELLAYAHDEHDDATAAAADGSDGEAAVHVRAGRGAATQAGEALDAVDALERDLQAAAASLASSRSETETDLAEAVDLVGRGVGGDRLSGAVARARSALAAAQTSGDRDPLTAQRRIEEADVALDEALAGVREDRARSDRARTALASALPAARAEVEAARSYLRGRRGAVGSRARAQLDQARSLLADAESCAQDDPARALALAQQADTAAESAQDEASRDVDGFGSMGGYGGGYGRRSRSSGSLEAAVLGGILGATLGGRRSGGGGGLGGGGFGGGGFGGGGGGFGGGGGGGGFGGGRF